MGSLTATLRSGEAAAPLLEASALHAERDRLCGKFRQGVPRLVGTARGEVRGIGPPHRIHQTQPLSLIHSYSTSAQHGTSRAERAL